MVSLSNHVGGNTYLTLSLSKGEVRDAHQSP